MDWIASQITSLPVVCSIVYSGVNQRKHQSSASLAFVREIHRGPVNFPHKWPVTRKMFPFDDVIMISVKVTPGDNFSTKNDIALFCVYWVLLMEWQTPAHFVQRPLQCIQKSIFASRPSFISLIHVIRWNIWFSTVYFSTFYDIWRAIKSFSLGGCIDRFRLFLKHKTW